MSAQHTPGPWFAFPLQTRDHGGCRPIFKNGLWAVLPEARPEQVPLAVIDRANDHHEPTRISAEFDARLIAAAPDLLEAVERAIRHAENIGISDGSYIGHLKAARAKAKDSGPGHGKTWTRSSSNGAGNAAARCCW